MYRISVFVYCILNLVNILSASPTKESCKLRLTAINPSVTYKDKLLIPSGDMEIFEIPYDEKITLSCKPGSIRRFHSETLTAQCKGDTELEINGMNENFSRLSCNLIDNFDFKIKLKSYCPNGGKLFRFGLSRPEYNLSAVMGELCFDPVTYYRLKILEVQEEPTVDSLPIAIEPVKYFNQRNYFDKESEYFMLLEQFHPVLPKLIDLNKIFHPQIEDPQQLELYVGLKNNSKLFTGNSAIPNFAWLYTKLENNSIILVYLEGPLSNGQYLCENQCNRLKAETELSYVDNKLLYCCNYADLHKAFPDIPNINGL